MHFPTDLNLLWDAQRKCADLLLPMVQAARLGGWRKSQDWRRKLKGQMIGLGRLAHGGGPNKEQTTEGIGAVMPQSKAGGINRRIREIRWYLSLGGHTKSPAIAAGSQFASCRGWFSCRKVLPWRTPNLFICTCTPSIRCSMAPAVWTG